LSFALLSAPGLVRAGTAVVEPAIVGEGVEGDYLRALHTLIHPMWVQGVVANRAALPASVASAALAAAAATPATPAKAMLSGAPAQGLPAAPSSSRPAPSSSPPASTPEVEPERGAVVMFSIRWDGTLSESILVRSSGLLSLDDAALAAVQKSGPFPPPPVDLFSDDGLAHFRWELSLKAPFCSSGTVRRYEEPLDEALPHLLVAGRLQEALARVARQLKAAPPQDAADPLSAFAEAWLAHPNPDPIADGEAAAVLARRGDARQIARLRVALGNRETVADASSALHALKVDLCPLVRDALMEPRDPEARELGVLALAAPGQPPLAPSSPCAQALEALALDPRATGRLRALAAGALVASLGEAARPMLAHAIKDENPTLRATALLLSARPGGGRPVLYRLLPFLHDPSIEVRAAAAAALVRSCGDVALDQLVLVWKERDPRPAVAVAAELGRMSTPASAAFLGRLLRRHDPAIDQAATLALAARHDQPARALLAPLAAAAVSDHAAATTGRAAAAGATPDAYLALLYNNPRQAAYWIVANFDRLEPRQVVAVLGSWLSKPPAPQAGSVSAR
jgi:TonB family protein